MYVKGVKIPFRKFTDQYHVLKVIFENKNTFGNEIFFSEIAEKIDRYNKTYTDKTIHNHLSAIKGKVAIETGIKDLFITTTQSVRINKDCL